MVTNVSSWVDNLSQEQKDKILLECIFQIRPNLKRQKDPQLLIEWIKTWDIKSEWWGKWFENYDEEWREQILQYFVYSLRYIYWESEELYEYICNSCDISIDTLKKDDFHLDTRKLRHKPSEWEKPKIEWLLIHIKDSILPLVDAKTRLEKSETIEFETVEETFLFILNLLDLNELAWYLNDQSEKVREFPISNKSMLALGTIIEIIWDSKLRDYTDKKVNLGSTYINWSFLENNFWYSLNDIKKISIRQKQS